MNKNDNFNNNIPNELNDNHLEQVVGGSGCYTYLEERTGYCSWCENYGPWKIYVNPNDPTDELRVCQTCGNAGYLWR